MSLQKSEAIKRCEIVQQKIPQYLGFLEEIGYKRKSEITDGGLVGLDSKTIYYYNEISRKLIISYLPLNHKNTFIDAFVVDFYNTPLDGKYGDSLEFDLYIEKYAPDFDPNFFRLSCPDLTLFESKLEEFLKKFVEYLKQYAMEIITGKKYETGFYTQRM